ncbi:MAG: PAS domain-containing protein [Chloroflexi bacterium]|nr:PAS domain-containing protein [Chloroflexota bacterium]
MAKISGGNGTSPLKNSANTGNVLLPPLADTLPVAMLVVNLEGRIDEVNAAGVTIFRAKNAAMILGRDLFDFCLPRVPDIISHDNPAGMRSRLRRFDGEEIQVSIQFAMTPGNAEKRLVVVTEIPDMETEIEDLLKAYQKQKQLNRHLGEILDLGRTFSLYSDLNQVMNRVVRVIGESLGYGFVGMYVNDLVDDRMRVATYTHPDLDFESFKASNPGNDWDILVTMTTNPSGLKKIGGKPVPVSFGMDTGFMEGKGNGSPFGAYSGGELWKLDGALIIPVKLNGSVNGGYIRVSDPLDSNACKNSSVYLSSKGSLSFCYQALWLYANQAAIAIDNAFLIERARLDIEERTRIQQMLTDTQNELEERIRQRTRQLEKLNEELRSEIMDREVAQQELDQQSKFLRQVLDSNPNLIFARDREGKYTLINEAAARFEGLTVDDIIGKTDSELHHDLAQVIRWRHEDLNVMDTLRDLVLPEERITDTHGVEHYMQTIKRPIIGPDGNADQVLGVAVEITARKMAEQRVARASIDLARAYDATIEGWSRALDLRDRETEGHSLRVTNMTLRLANCMGIDQREHLNLRRGALLHDIGKMGIPDEILFKKGSLTDEEWVIMRKHPVYAYDMLTPIDYLHPALIIPKYHHEKWDGTGYPEKLSGEMIPLAARIFAIVDVWDALTSDRPYRAAWSVEAVLEYIKQNSGTHFDPKVVDVFVSHLDEIVFNKEPANSED